MGRGVGETVRYNSLRYRNGVGTPRDVGCNDQSIVVYVPVPGSFPERMIDRGSGIVGRSGQSGDGRIMVYYESNRYGASNIITLADRVYHAASRLLMRHPTLACASFFEQDLIPIGLWDWDTRTIRLNAPDDVVLAWIGLVDDLQRELRPGDEKAKGSRDSREVLRRPWKYQRLLNKTMRNPDSTPLHGPSST